MYTQAMGMKISNWDQKMEETLNQVLNIIAAPVACLIMWIALTSMKTMKRILSLLAFLFREDVAGKVVLVTGASSGIGEQVAYEYATKGACLVLVARREGRLREVAARCLCFGSPDVIFLPTDVSNAHHCKVAVHAAVAHFGRLDHLVNNAGITSVSLLEDCEDLDNLRPVMDINFWGSAYMTHFALPHLRRSKGKIMVISSASSWLPLPRMSFYNASKAAMVALFEALRIELWPDVKITIATPGYIESEMTQGKHLSNKGHVEVDQEMRDVQVGLVPVGKVDAFAKAVVCGTRQGERLVIEPDWIRLTRVWKTLCPEVLDWLFWWLYNTKPGSPPRAAATKWLLDLTGAKPMLHLPSAH